MGKLVDLLQMQLGTSGEQPVGSGILQCPECKVEGIPTPGRRSGTWMIVHHGGCSRPTVTGIDRDDVNQKWREQNA